MEHQALQPVNVAQKLSKITRFWTPGIVAEANNQYVKLAKLKGEFVWHKHEDEDELFLVVEGQLTLRFRDRQSVTLKPGELYVVPRGIEHQPVADVETHVVVFEPKSTLHTGNVKCDLTVDKLDWI